MRISISVTTRSAHSSPIVDVVVAAVVTPAPFMAALMLDGIPFTSFVIGDVEVEHERLVALGVRFTPLPTEMGSVTTAVFDDTCGNLIQMTAQV